MIKILIVVLLIYSGVAISKDEWVKLGAATKKAQECVPFGLRINWGRSVLDASSQQKLGVRFNTQQPCDSINLLLNEGLLIHCPPRDISTFKMSDENIFVSYVHQCSLSTQIEYDQPFTYNIIDSDTQNTYFEKDFEITLKNPHDSKRLVKFIHFSDWAKIKEKADERPEIVSVVKDIVKKQNIDGIILNGDLGYDLNNNVEHHLQFLTMLQEISKNTPIIVNRGNHQYGDAGKMFCEYFQEYDLCKRNATALSIGSAYISLFDPQAALIPRKFDKYTVEERQSSRKNLALDLEKGENSGRNIIALSHYPMLCSYPTSEHCIPHEEYNEILPLYVNLQGHFNTLLDYKVPIHLAGHVHTYQRSHKILRGYKYGKIVENTDIEFDKSKDQFFIQVVDGVAGSDQDLYGDYTDKGEKKEVQPFIASYNLNTVGFGILEVCQEKIAYEHFGVNKSLKLTSFDKFVLKISGKRSLEDQQANTQL